LSGHGRGCALEGEFNDNRARVFGTPQEVELDLKSGDVAFADAVKQGD
jgi:hypothetical protein